ncbi:MAG: nucleobase:cation symporter-2 family protein [Tissierellia bacterium]|nr:nucleobase:cation symporter-2 family protein [Tissierellia bacterium]
MGLSIALAIQHILAAFAGIVAVPLIVGTAIGLSPEQNTYIISMTLFVSGIATLIQSIGFGPVGGKIPMVMGTDFTFVGPAIAVASTLGLPGYFGATFFGSFIEIILSKFIKKLRNIFPPIVTGTVIVSIGLTMIPVAIDWIGGYEEYGVLKNLFLALIVMVTIVILNQFGKGFLSSAAILIGIVIGYIVAAMMNMVDFSSVMQAKLFVMPTPLKFGIKFDLPALIAFAPAYLVTTIETVGGGLLIFKACDEEFSSEKLAGSVMGDGIGSMIAGIFGSGPNTSFSQNIGIIPLTGVASRFVVAIAGGILMLMGLFPKLAALVNIMPSPVLGGAGIIMFGMIAVGGIKNFQEVNFNKRNSLILAISLGLGLGVAFRPEILSHLPENIQIIFRSGMTTATITAILLNLILPGREKEIKD